MHHLSDVSGQTPPLCHFGCSSGFSRIEDISGRLCFVRTTPHAPAVLVAHWTLLEGELNDGHSWSRSNRTVPAGN